MQPEQLKFAKTHEWLHLDPATKTAIAASVKRPLKAEMIAKKPHIMPAVVNRFGSK